MCYVGSAVDLWGRHTGHRGYLKDPRRGVTPLYRAMREFGWDAFDFEVLERCEKAMLLAREGFYIAFLNSAGVNGFNVRSSPQHNAIGSEPSESTRARMSAAAKAHCALPEVKARKSEIMTERWGDPKYRQAKAAENREMRSSPDAKAETGALSREMWKARGHRSKFVAGVSKPIAAMLPDGSTLRFPSLNAAISGLGVARTTVWRCLKTGKLSRSGLQIRYLPRERPVNAATARSDVYLARKREKKRTADEAAGIVRLTPEQKRLKKNAAQRAYTARKKTPRTISDAGC